MKKLTTIKIVLVALVFSACNFSKSINKDLVTGATSKGDGLQCNDITIQIDGNKENRNTFTFGENVVFVFDGITGFKEENEKVYPEMSIIVVKKENQMVLSEPSLLNLVEGTSHSPLQLQANLIASFPYQNDEEYEVQIAIWDTKGDGKFTYNMPFTVQENKVLNIKSTNITYKSIFIWNENKNKMVFDNKMSAKEKYSLVLEGIDGLTVENGKVFPALSVYLNDQKGNEIIASTNLYRDTTDGLDAIEFTKGQIPIILTFYDGQFFNPCKLSVILKDTKSMSELNISADLEIELFATDTNL